MLIPRFENYLILFFLIGNKTPVLLLSSYLIPTKKEEEGGRETFLNDVRNAVSD